MTQGNTGGPEMTDADIVEWLRLAGTNGHRHHKAADEIERLRAELVDARKTYSTAMQNNRETFDAMCAMRNDINDHIAMPSLESDLLSGPENSVFCAAVAGAVVAAVATKSDPIGAAWMREQAAIACNVVAAESKEYNIPQMSLGASACCKAIRAIPLPTNADLLAEAMKMPEVQVLVAATRRQVENVERWLETGTPAGPDESKAIYDAMTSALTPFTAAKATT